MPLEVFHEEKSSPLFVTRLQYVYCGLNQGILKKEVSLYH
jgi:hypothetical protein